MLDRAVDIIRRARRGELPSGDWWFDSARLTEEYLDLPQLTEEDRVFLERLKETTSTAVLVTITTQEQMQQLSRVVDYLVRRA